MYDRLKNYDPSLCCDGARAAHEGFHDGSGPFRNVLRIVSMFKVG